MGWILLILAANGISGYMGWVWGTDYHFDIALDFSTCVGFYSDTYTEGRISWKAYLHLIFALSLRCVVLTTHLVRLNGHNARFSHSEAF